VVLLSRTSTIVLLYGIKPRCYSKHLEDRLWEQFGHLRILWESNGNSQDGEGTIADARSSWRINEACRKIYELWIYSHPINSTINAISLAWSWTGNAPCNQLVCQFLLILRYCLFSYSPASRLQYY
jgi:hypothetical protein